METIDTLFNIIQTLRSKKGCEWDKQQTPESMWKCLAEEVYELEEAIVKDDLKNIREELGDVLFQLVFILQIFQERKAFSISDVISDVAKKMIRRHPHVYKDAVVTTRNELNQQWDQIKAKEKKGNDKNSASILDSIPKGMPSLIRALKVSKCVVKEGFDWDNIHEVLDTVRDEINEFESALNSGNKKEIQVEFGDVLFTLVNVARFAQFHPETALANSTAKFEGRFRLMESQLMEKKLKLNDLKRDQIDWFWDQAKQSYDMENI